jgi:protein transport protein DSL1/ZW10
MVYFCVGTLLNTTVIELVSCIVKLEDIRERESDLIANLLLDFNDSAQSDLLTPILDKYSAPVGKLVPAWGRLAETKFVLKARLQDIIDRWAGGKGPLAAELTAAEVKQLIRALFQNTDKRAAALSAIS